MSLSGKNGLDTPLVGPNLKHIFKVSLDVTRYDYYTVGKYHTQIDRYVPDNTSIDGWDGLRYDYGNFYASKSFLMLGRREGFCGVGLMSPTQLKMMLKNDGPEFR